ncbi:MAG: glutaredoxin domain-containing protein [Bacilli bacterium]|jgi:glutaredoxin-like YruB-family protein
MQKIKIYTTPSCHFCKEAKEFFDKNKISYTSIDVAADATARREMIEKSNQMGVPVIIVGEEVIVGFRKAKLEELLHLK